MSGCRSEVGRLFQILGPATLKLLSLSRVLFLRTVRTLAWVQRSWGRPESAIRYRQRTGRHEERRYNKLLNRWWHL